MASSLWVAKNLYVKEIYLRETRVSSKQQHRNNAGVPKNDATTTLNRYMSIFFALFLSSNHDNFVRIIKNEKTLLKFINFIGQIWASLISSLILKPEVDASNPNQTSSNVAYCGANGCPWHTLHLAPLKKPKIESVLNLCLIDPLESKRMWYCWLYNQSNEKVYLLCGVMASLTVLSILINVIFLDNLDQTRPISPDPNDGLTSPVKKFLNQLVHPFQVLITPFSLWIGFIQGFMIADFTRVYTLLYGLLWANDWYFLMFLLANAIN